MTPDEDPRPIPAAEMAEYRRTARRRWQAERARRAERYDQAWQLARQAADLLRREYGVTRVTLFGSLVDRDRFDTSSDVDLAAWGLTSVNWLHATGAVRALSTAIAVNLVDVAMCSPEFLSVIEREGVEL